MATRNGLRSAILLSLQQEEGQTAAELAANLALDHRQATDNLSQAKKAGLVSCELDRQGNTRVGRYYLTDAGREYASVEHDENEDLPLLVSANKMLVERADELEKHLIEAKRIISSHEAALDAKREKTIGWMAHWGDEKPRRFDNRDEAVAWLESEPLADPDEEGYLLAIVGVARRKTVWEEA